MKSSYDVLGVTTGASSAEIRTAYLKRVKVLHPDRFDKSSQADEWQLANDMLRELNEAYEQLKASSDNGSGNNVQAQNHEPTIIKCTSCGTKNRTPDIFRPAKCGRCGMDLPFEVRTDQGRTQGYWNSLGQIVAQHLKAGLEVVPLETNNFDVHLLSLEAYVAANFDCQVALTVLDVAQVDPVALKAGKDCQDAFLQYSTLVTQRITLVSRAKHLKEKYPYWKTLWSGYGGLGISTAEYQADELEWKSINPQLGIVANQIGALDAAFKQKIEVAVIELLAKYGESFVIY